MALPLFKKKSPEHPLNLIKYVIAIAAGKGGVGKSSITVNLALGLKKMGYRVGVMDIDIYGPSIRRMLPEDEMPRQSGDRIIPATCLGIKMISMAYFRKDGEAAVVRAPIANNLVQQFIKMVDWGELDFLLVDFPPGTGDVQLTLSQHANLTGAIMVTTPQEVALMDVRKAIHLFDQVKVPILGIVENMSYFIDQQTKEPIYIFGQGGGERLAKEMGVPLLARIPIDPQLCRCGDEGKSLFELDPSAESETARQLLTMAQQVASHAEAMKKENSRYLQNFELTWKEMD